MLTRIRTPKLTRLPLLAFAGALVASALLGIAVIIRGELDETEGKLLLSTSSMLVASLVSIPAFAQVERRTWTEVSFLAIGATLTALILLLTLVWAADGFDQDGALNTFGSFAITGFALNHALLLLLGRSADSVVRTCLYATIAVIAAVAAMLIVAIWTGDPEGGFWRLFGVLLILDALGTILVPVLAKLRRLGHPA